MENKKNNKKIFLLFKKLVSIDSVSLKESNVRDFIKEYLRDFPVDISEDKTAKKINGDCGNLIIKPRNPSKPSKLVLLAHMDTIKPTSETVVQEKDGILSSKGDTILGADNRAGITIILSTLTWIFNNFKEIPDFRVIFTVAEEIGMKGSKNLESYFLNDRFGICFDSSLDPGYIIYKGAGSAIFEATFKGKNAHAGISPEKGVNAISIASKAINETKQGKLDDEATLNIGYIKGGEEVNVVPDEVLIRGETRSYSKKKIEKEIENLKGIFFKSTKSFGGKLSFKWSYDFLPFDLGKKSELVKIVRESFFESSFVKMVKYRGGSDANVLNFKGIPSVNLGIGAKNPHSNEEFISKKDLLIMIEFAKNLIKRY